MTQNSDKTQYCIRLGRDGDLPLLGDIERSAGRAFAERGMQAIADDDPPSVVTLAQYANAQRLWVAADHRDQPVGYIMIDRVDDGAHIEQVSVHEDHAGQKLGKRLIDRVFEWTRTHELSQVTLTTFRDVPWNAPYYERLGFAVLPEHAYSKAMQAIRDHEKSLGLDRWPRVAMYSPV